MIVKKNPEIVLNSEQKIRKNLLFQHIHIDDSEISLKFSPIATHKETHAF